MSFKKYLLIPQLVSYAVRAPRDPAKAWDRYWSGIHHTGPRGEVLWDTADPAEIEEVLRHVKAHFDPDLPVLDLGCGNGRFSRLLAEHFPAVLGVDVSSHAVDRAREESAGRERVSFRVLDGGQSHALLVLASEFGPMNVFIRGFLHVLDPAHRSAVLENVRELLGERGAIHLSESSIDGDPLDLLVRQGATPTSMPEPVRRCIASGIRPPSRFGAAEVEAYLPADRWEILASGPTTMYTMPLHGQSTDEPLPSYFAVARRKR